MTTLDLNYSINNSLKNKIIDKVAQISLDSYEFVKNNEDLYSYTLGNKELVYVFTFNELDDFLKWYIKNNQHKFILELMRTNYKVLFEYFISESVIDINYKQFKNNIIGRNGGSFLVDLISKIGINKFISDVLIERKQYRLLGIYKSKENMYKFQSIYL
jgi:hypothetical protein